MRIGVFQAQAGVGDPQDRLARLAEALEGQALDLVVCPELFMSGYDVGDELLRLAEPRDGAFARAVGALAMESGCAVAYGYPEWAEGIVYNAAQVIDGQGNWLANHRKLMLPPGFEGSYFNAGSSLTSFEFGGLQFGLLICYDAEFPEAVRACAQGGADIVLVPTALGAQWPVVAEKLMPTRAFENGVWLCYANHAGAEASRQYLGKSCIVAPDGSDAARAGRQAALISAEVSAELVQSTRARLPNLPAAKALCAVLGR
ncbi:MAG: carbon-nitrogen hydrolase family protein [Rhodobacteraceae bacterium]|nr:carbon-nitrogen hydrolase family protein [Paracoccaceae bacterium]